MEAGDVGITQSRGDLPAVHQIFGGADTQSESLGQFWIIKKLIGIGNCFLDALFDEFGNHRKCQIRITTWFSWIVVNHNLEKYRRVTI